MGFGENKNKGQFIIKLANASDTDEVIYQLTSGIKRLFGFSDSFPDITQQNLPLMNQFLRNLNKQDKVLIKIFKLQRDLISSINIQFEWLNKELIFYSPTRGELLFRDIIYNAHIEDGDVIGDVEYAKPYYLPIGDIMAEDWQKMKPHTYDDILKLFKVGRVRTKYRGKVSKERYVELKKISKQYFSLISLHKHIDLMKQDLRNTLSGITKGESLYENKSFRKYLSRYNRHCKTSLIIEPDDSFKHTADFMTEKFYLLPQEDHAYRIISAYEIPIVFSVVEFFKEARNVVSIRKCPICKKYFIAKDRKRKKCYSDECKREYERLKKRKQREVDPLTYL